MQPAWAHTHLLALYHPKQHGILQEPVQAVGLSMLLARLGMGAAIRLLNMNGPCIESATRGLFCPAQKQRTMSRR